MAISVFDLFKIGIGPSSSHTVGPMRAALEFTCGLRDQGLLKRTHAIKAELFGSLGATGKGHGSDKAVLLGLIGEMPEQVDTDSVDEKLARIREQSRLALLGEHEIDFREKEHLIMHKRKSLPYHPNGMCFHAFTDDGENLCSKVYYSVGGGFVVDEEAAGADRIKEDDTPQPYPFKTAAELLKLCAEHKHSISQIMLENEKAWRSEAQIRQRLLDIWEVMQACVKRGCQREGILPGGMQVRRRGSGFIPQIEQRPGGRAARSPDHPGLG